MNADDHTGTLLRNRMAADTAHLVARPDAAQQAILGGRRRIRRHRTTAAGAVTVLALLIAVPFTPVFDRIKRSEAPAHPDPSDRYGMLLDRPTEGDLSDDVGYQQAVLALWNGRVKGLANGIGKQSQGRPTVAWAGTTAAGPAALVVQLATLPESPDTDPADAGRARTLVGFIGVDSKAQPRLVSYDYWHSGTTGDGIVGWFADSARQGLVVRDIGVPVGWSFSANSERFEALPGGNGATAVRVPDGIDPAQVRVHRLPYDRAEADLPIAEPVSGAAGTTEPAPFLSWPVAPMFLSAGSQLADPQSVFGTALTRKGGVATASGAPQLLATGRDSGEEVLIGVAAKNGIGRIFTVLIDSAGRTTVLDGGVIDPQADLPIMVRLPDHRGWAVVRGQAGFEWRAKTGRWHEGGQYAAILPETAVKVRITPYWGTGQQASVWLR